METKIKMNKKELEIFSNEMLNDFKMMMIFAGGNKDKCNCHITYGATCVKFPKKTYK